VAPIAPGWIDEANPKVQVQTCWALRERIWWNSFNDPTLSLLIQNAYDQNLTLRAAGMRILAAQAQRDVVTGDLFPQFQEIFGGYARIAESLETANQGATGVNRFFDDWIFGGQLAWELDFWGKFRRSVAAADARLDAQIEDYDDVLVLLVADVASTYVEIRTLQQRLVYARQNLTIQNESVRLAQIKFDAGTRDSQIDLPQAQSNQAEIASLIPDLELALRRAMNRLSVLLGMPPADLGAILGTAGIPTPPPDIAIGIPADLLRQRPDVRRAERELAAQSEEIGIAVANLYPHISIHGTIFVNAEQFADLFKESAWGGAVGPTFRWDVLNYGRLRARVREQQARFNELVYNYQQTVLQANQEAEDAIALFLLSHEKVAALDLGTQASSKAVNIGLQLYGDGLADFNRLSNVQLDLARQQDDLAFAQGQIAQGWIEVYRSLGGGWQIRLANAQPFMPGIQPPPADTPSEILPPTDSQQPVESSPEPAEANGDDNSAEEPDQSNVETRVPEFADTGPVNPDGQTANSIKSVISQKLSNFRERLLPRRASSDAGAIEPETTDHHYAADDAVPPPMPQPIEPRPEPRPMQAPDVVFNLAGKPNSANRSPVQKPSPLANARPRTPIAAVARNQTPRPAPRRLHVSPVETRGLVDQNAYASAPISVPSATSRPGSTSWAGSASSLRIIGAAPAAPPAPKLIIAESQPRLSRGSANKIVFVEPSITSHAASVQPAAIAQTASQADIRVLAAATAAAPEPVPTPAPAPPKTDIPEMRPVATYDLADNYSYPAAPIKSRPELIQLAPLASATRNAITRDTKNGSEPVQFGSSPSNFTRPISTATRHQPDLLRR
jgi:NodT family efflux transporter outer membrane factor (OMF) lipoprotein